MSCLKRRAENICSDELDLKEEMDRLKKTFTKNGFPRSTLNRRLCRTATRAEKPEGKKTLVIPYFPGLSDKIGKAARKFNLNVRYSKVKNLGSMLCNTKLDHLPDLQKGGVLQSIVTSLITEWILTSLLSSVREGIGHGGD